MAAHRRGLDGRSMNEDGRIREKRGDTKVGTLRKELGPNFAPDRRADTKLDTLRKEFGADSLDDLLRKMRHK